MNLEDIDIFIDDPPTNGPSNPTSEPTTDDFDIFQGDIISYSQLMSQMTLDPSADTFGTQYEDPRASSYDTPDPFTQVLETQGTSTLTVKSDQKTHTTRLSLEEYFVSVDVFFILF
jgi:hypothetical protein